MWKVKELNMKLFNIKVMGLMFLGIFLLVSCERHKDEKIAVDYSCSEKWDKIFRDASKVFKVGEVKEITFENPYNANRCVLIRGGSSFVSPDEIYNEYLEKQIPELIAEKLVREDMGEGVNLFFVKNDAVISSVKLISVDSEESIYCQKIGEQITFSIQIPSQIYEWMKDPNFFNNPEIGQDYLTNPSRPKPIEIIAIE